MRPDVIGNRRVEQESGDVGVTSTETRDSWSDRLSPRNWPLVWKLVAVGLVPALLAIVLGVLRVADQAQSASELGSANRLLEVRGEVADAATALRTERDRAVVFVAERRLGNRGSLTDAIGGSDRAIEDARSGIAAANGLDAATRSAVEQADGGFAQLSVLRADVTGSAPLLAAQVVQRYTADHRPRGRPGPCAAATGPHPRGRRAQRRADGGHRGIRGARPAAHRPRAPRCGPAR